MTITDIAYNQESLQISDDRGQILNIEEVYFYRQFDIRNYFSILFWHRFFGIS